MRRTSILCSIALFAVVASTQAAKAAPAAEVNRLSNLRQIPITSWEKVDSSPRAIYCPTVAQAPMLDGKLDDPCWKTAAKADGFLKCDDNIPVDLPAAVPSEVLLCRDKENIYLAWKLYGDQAKAQAAAFNPAKHYEFAYQYALSTTIFQPPGSDDWIRLQLNNSGSFSMTSKDLGIGKYPGAARNYAAPFENGAIIEVAIPFSNPGLGVPRDGQWWRFQLGRVDNSEWTSWSNSRGFFEQPGRFGYLYFGNADDFKKATVPIPAKLEVYGERYHYNGDDPVTQFIAAAEGIPLEGNRLHYRLLHVEGKKSTAVSEGFSEALQSPKVAVSVMLDGLAPGQYQMEATMVKGNKPLPGAPVGTWDFAISNQKSKPMEFPAAGVPIRVHEQDIAPNIEWPVATGVPLPRNAIRDVNELALYENGQRIAVQISAKSFWTPLSNSQTPPDSKYNGGLKWVGISFIAKYDGLTPRQYILKRAPAGEAAPASPLKVTDGEGNIEVVTGPMRLVINKANYNGIAGAWLDVNNNGKFEDGEQMVKGGGGASLSDQAGTAFRADGTADTKHATQVFVEEQGPSRVVIAAKGWYHDANGNPLCIYHTRYIAFAGQPWMRVQQRTILTYDTRTQKLSDLAFSVPVGIAGYNALFGDKGQYIEARLSDTTPSVSLHQDRDNHFRVLQEGAKEPALQVQQEGGRSQGVAAITTREGQSVTVILKDFWQKFPKELELTRQGITLHFWPRHGYNAFADPEVINRDQLHKLRFAHEGKLMDLQIPKYYADRVYDLTKEGEYVNLAEGIEPGLGANGQGVAISNDFAIDLRNAGRQSVTPELLQFDPAAYVDPQYACATGVLDPMTARDEAKYPGVERLINRGYLSHTRFFERDSSWGMFNYKDLNSFNLPAMTYPNTHRMWQGAHAQQPETAWTMYFRSGDHEWLDWARAYSDHFMNLDTCNYDDPEHLMCGTTPDGKQLVGCFIHLAGAQYHCKAYVHWGSECNAATHWICPTEYLLDYYLTDNNAALDNYKLWATALNRMPMMSGGSRDVNCTMAHLVPYYQYSGDPQLLLYIQRAGKGLLSVPLINHESGQYHSLWLQRYYDLTRDDNVKASVIDFMKAGGGYPSFCATAYRVTGDPKYLTMMSNGVIDAAQSIYLNPADPVDGYNQTTPESTGSFFMMGLPTYLAALEEAKLPLQLTPPEKPAALATLKADTTITLQPMENYLKPLADQKTPVTLIFNGRKQLFHDYTGSSVDTTIVTVTDAAGQTLLDTSICAAAQRTHAILTVDPQQHPGPWRVFIGKPVEFKFQGAASLQQADMLATFK